MTKNRLTRHASGKTVDEKKYEKFDVLDDNGQGDDEKDDEFIVKMILRPLNSEEASSNPTNRPSKYSKILKKSKHQRHEEKVTLTQMIKKSTDKSNEKDDEIDLAKESSSSDEESDSSIDEVVPDSDARTSKGLKNTNLFLSAYGGGPRQKTSLIKLMHDTKPKYVILYDSELWFVRQLETYKALNFELPLRVYFLMYTNSCEEQRYLTSIRSEKEAFEILIKEKAVIYSFRVLNTIRHHIILDLARIIYRVLKFKKKSGFSTWSKCIFGI